MSKNCKRNLKRHQNRAAVSRACAIVWKLTKFKLGGGQLKSEDVEEEENKEYNIFTVES